MKMRYRKLKNRDKVKDLNDLLRGRKDKARRARHEEEERERDSSRTGSVTFISGPTVCFPNTGFGDGREWDRAH